MSSSDSRGLGGASLSPLRKQKRDMARGANFCSILARQEEKLLEGPKLSLKQVALLPPACVTHR